MRCELELNDIKTSENTKLVETNRRANKTPLL